MHIIFERGSKIFMGRELYDSDLLGNVGVAEVKDPELIKKTTSII